MASSTSITGTKLRSKPTGVLTRHKLLIKAPEQAENVTSTPANADTAGTHQL